MTAPAEDTILIHRREEQRREQARQREEERRRQHEREAKERARRTREIIQAIKAQVVDWDIRLDAPPLQAKARAKQAIERELRPLPILDLPPMELNQIAEAVREEVYASYKQVNSTNQLTQSTEDDMAKRTVVSGFYECPQCNEEYELDRAPEEDVICNVCRVPLEEVDDDDEASDEQW